MEKIVGYTKKRTVNKTNLGTITNDEDIPVKQNLTGEDYYYGKSLRYLPLKKIQKTKDGFYEGMVEIEFDVIKCKKAESIRFKQKCIDKELEKYASGKLSLPKDNLEVLCDLSNLKYSDEKVRDHGEEYLVQSKVSVGMTKVLSLKRKLKDYPVYFIRHNFKEQQILDNLLKEDLISIHFTNEFHLDWEDYSPKGKKTSGFKRAWDCLKQISVSGAFVVAEYGAEVCKIGYVPPNTEIKNHEIKINKKIYKGLKTLKLTDPREVKYSEFPVISVMKPPFGTVSHIKTSKSFFLDLFFRNEIGTSLNQMHYKAQELMCYEWLKSNFCPEELRVDLLLLNIGHKLQAIDILAMTTKGKILSAQVTYYDDINKLSKKEDELLKFSPDKSVKVLFAKFSKDLNKKTSDLWEISLEKVFNDFKSSEKYHKFLEFSICGNTSKL